MSSFELVRFEILSEISVEMPIKKSPMRFPFFVVKKLAKRPIESTT
jgi:hypothetical protein